MLAKFAATDASAILHRVTRNDVNLPLEFIGPKPEDTKLFKPYGTHAKLFESHPLTYHYHNWGILHETWKNDPKLNEFYHATSLSYTTEGVPFISTLEAINYPFLGV